MLSVIKKTIDGWLDEHTGSTVVHSMYHNCNCPGISSSIAVPWWRHKMEHFPRYWPFVRGIHRHGWLLLTKASDAELWCFPFDLLLNKQLSKQSKRRLFKTPLRSLWRHCNVIICLIFHFSNRTRSQRPIACGQSWSHQGYARTGVPYIGATVFMDGVCQKSGWTYHCGM